MKQKNNGSLIFDILIATIIAGLAVSVAIKMPVMLMNFWKKIQIKTNNNFLRTRTIGLLKQDFSTAIIPEKYLKKIVLKNYEENSIALINNQKNESINPRQETKKNENTLFLLKEKGGNMDFCFFISTNLIPSYSKLKPKLAGIFYILEKMPEATLGTDSNTHKLQGQNLFQLSRIETEDLLISKDLTENNIQKKDKMIIMKHIKKFTIELTALVPKEETSKKNDEQPATPKTTDLVFELKLSHIWPLEEKEKSQSLLPGKVKIICDYFDEQLDEQVFELETIIFSSYSIKATDKQPTIPNTPDAKSLNPEKDQTINKS